VSVVVPTWGEAANLPELVARLDRVRRAHALELELVVVDDDSRDGIEEWVAGAGFPWVRLVVRRGERGVGGAVVEGLRGARGDLLVVMDADLSHPPERLPEVIGALEAGHDFVIGSRSVPGASSEDRGLLRWIDRRAGTWLARPFTGAADPLSGFFALRRETFAAARDLAPVGRTIGLELLVKCGARRVAEVPIHLARRRAGEGKRGLRERLRYVQHVRRLWIHGYPTVAYLGQFVTVGASGVLVNVAVLSALLGAGAAVPLAVGLAIAVSMLSNFALNRRFTFSYARRGSILAQLVGFLAASSLGAAVNYGVTVATLARWPGLAPQLAAVGGVIAGTGFNYVTSRYVVFRKGRASSRGRTPGA
jgi:dolichol-phosphate mannosyltransferase